MTEQRPVTQTYAITGMTCEHCVRAVTGELSALPGVEEVQVDLTTGTATVASAAPLPVESVRAAVDEAGYELAGGVA
ncbi:heavy metal-associated domain-containing protein [Micromonospora sp. 4G57]|uniref:Heavy metal-associated domain-containing protein n=1 Tax=Micromonospora sicca TaxID=2202420 RepID=A0ABU5J7E7_9ACTN|nr:MULTISPECIES: heavy metal-associated domain-containing protein [unclassified Micromonospora]MDZ5444692.1 heavy metal-associated domain-containing protein [Micromonospora sp. 4G57]MDZ5488507.1 heavy metal-associated domain-containing protein [Micromonospora sp. 4G53]